jgi:hypothetical protein
MSITQQITHIVEQLPDVEQRLVFELVKRISPDDILTLEDLADIAQARAEYARGETIADSDINWD